MNNDVETYLLIITGLISTQLLSSWLSVFIGMAILILTLIKIIKEIRKWNYDKEKRLEEREMFLLDKKKREKELGE